MKYLHKIIIYTLLGCCLTLSAFAREGYIVGWGEVSVAGGNNVFNTNVVMAGSELLSNAVNVSAVNNGIGFAILDDSSMRTINGGLDPDRISAIPGHFVSVTSDGIFCLAIKKDGRVVGWGDNRDGQTDIPMAATNIIQVGITASTSVALRGDGKVITWGFTHDRQPQSLTNLAAIAVSPLLHGVHWGLKKDGTVLDWQNGNPSDVNPVAGLSNITAIAVGPGNTLALKKDGTVIAMNGWFNGETNVPPGLSNVVAIAAGGYRIEGFAGQGYSLALKSDGTIATWGVMTYKFHPAFVPDGLSNVVAIATSDDDYSWAITTNRAVAERFLQLSAPKN